MQSVVPSLDEMFMEGIKNYIGVPCLKVSSDPDTGVKIRMKTLPDLGLHRLLNAVAGVEKYGAPLVIVDLAQQLRC